MLPYVVLKGAGVAIGRGKEALWAIGGGSSTPRSCLAGNGTDKHLTEVLKRNLGFVEVADGRVSRLHCIISAAAAGGGGSGGCGGGGGLGSNGSSGSQAVLEDCSSNGTFLNHRKLAKGESGARSRRAGEHLVVFLRRVSCNRQQGWHECWAVWVRITGTAGTAGTALQK